MLDLSYFDRSNEFQFGDLQALIFALKDQYDSNFKSDDEFHNFINMRICHFIDDIVGYIDFYPADKVDSLDLLFPAPDFSDIYSNFKKANRISDNFFNHNI